ncbi:MAG TPA: alpha-L-arabinofuranosidase C-terminal domain-containing protein [Ferruginibacter sp.]|nr:alpha-L-arabinofuranosidase C-terminal domain-containing protein [Ferruginibacter sp.]HMP21639.1 alpha-L-arabinofuranosidase C-terminal domain-containing protein [Ferruginibacter sp.]
MKKIIAALLPAIPLLLQAQQATIKIDIERTIGEIDPRIYGVFMEPIHLTGKMLGLPDTVSLNTLYGTLYDPASPLADENGFKKDYINAMKELKVTNMRWPGGNFLMGYNWEDGIGPKDKRPVRINMAWGGLESNQVGTDEWIQLNKSMNSENIVCVNLGLGSIMEAAHWVEYCNYKGGTYYSDLRAKNGHREPYNIKIWDLGNEVDGKPWELGHKNAEDYIEIAREAAKAMKAVDNTIELVGCGSSWYNSSGWDEWNRKVLTGIGDKIKYLSIHSYWENAPDYYSFMGASAKIFEERITITAGEIQAVSATQGFKNPIYLSVDEWGAFGRNFMSILPVAQSLNSFIRHADVVKMANFTLMTSLLSNDPEKGNYKSPLFYTFGLFSNNCLGNAIDTYVACDTFNTGKYKGIPYLDVTATYSKKDNTVFINVVNRHKDKTITAGIMNTSALFTGKGEASIISSNNLEEPFSFNKKEQYIPVKQEVNTKNNQLTFAFPPHSFTQIKIAVKVK